MNKLQELVHRLGKHPHLRPINVDVDPNLTRADFSQAVRTEREKRHAVYREHYGKDQARHE